MKQAINVPFKLDENSLRVDETEAHDALREALANCLTNADYNERRGVVLLWKEDGLHLSNPGGFRIDIKDAYIGGNSDPRNETMMKMFSLINIGERAGGGIPNMVKKWMSAGYGKPVLSERVNPERSSIFLPLGKGSKSGKSDISSFISSPIDEITLDTDQTAVLDAMAKNPSATYPEIAQNTGFSESKVYRISNALRKKGMVEREGSRKTGIWKVLTRS